MKAGRSLPDRGGTTPSSDHWTFRHANGSDRALVSSLLDSAHWKHQHLDWFDTLELLGQQPFLLALDGTETVGCLACPPECLEVAWVRVFAAAGGHSLSRVWESLWLQADPAARQAGASVAAALPTVDWMPPLLERSGFEHVYDVVFLERLGQLQPPPPHSSPGVIRPMVATDMDEVARADQRAFAPLWRLAECSLDAALAQATVATIVEVDGRLIGYQICTASAFGAHLARLAVDPDYQGRGVGTALVIDALHALARRGFHRVTVNTQSMNVPSLKLYERLGFRRTRQDYPVYQRDLDRRSNG